MHFVTVHEVGDSLKLDTPTEISRSTAVLTYDFENSVGYWLAITTNAMQRVLTERLAPYGITFRQMQVIAWLVRQQKLTQSQLACLMMVEPPTLAGILNRMESCGWITRTQCKIDRRKNLVEVTDKVESVWQQITACIRQVRSEAVAGLSSQEQTELFRMLRHVHQNLHIEKSATCETELPGSTT